MEHALIWRQSSKRLLRRDYFGDPVFGPLEWRTTVLATGSWDEMQERWRIADERLHRFDYLDGHVEVRAIDDPKVTDAIPQQPWPGWDREAARLAILPGDKVRIHIYANTYTGTVVSAGLKTALVRFRAANRDGSGWGGEPPLRERRAPIWRADGSRLIEEVIK